MKKVDVNQVVNRIKYEMKKQLDYKGYADGTFIIIDPQQKYGSYYTIATLANEWLEVVYYYDDVPNKQWLEADTLKEIETRIAKWVHKIETHKNDWLNREVKNNADY